MSKNSWAENWLYSKPLDEFLWEAKQERDFLIYNQMMAEVERRNATRSGTKRKMPNAKEQASWREVPSHLAKLLKDLPSKDQTVMMEYTIPPTETSVWAWSEDYLNRIDTLLLGTDGQGKKGVVVLENKLWSENHKLDHDVSSSHRIKVLRSKRMKRELHPSEQAAYYRECIENLFRYSNTDTSTMAFSAFAYLPNIDYLQNGSVQHKVLCHSKFDAARQEVPFYTAHFRGKLASILRDSVGNGKGGNVQGALIEMQEKGHKNWLRDMESEYPEC